MFGNYQILGWLPQAVSGGGPPVGGSGIVNRISKWITANTLGNSIIFDDGTKVGIGTTTPTAFLHLPASIAANASFRIPSGVQPVTPNAGDIWGVGAFLRYFDGTRVVEFAKILKASANLNFPNTLAQTSSELTIAVPGAVPGDVVSLGLPAGAIPANSTYLAYVSAGNTVTVRFCNFSALAINPAAGTFTVYVYKN